MRTIIIKTETKKNGRSKFHEKFKNNERSSSKSINLNVRIKTKIPDKTLNKNIILFFMTYHKNCKNALGRI